MLVLGSVAGRISARSQGTFLTSSDNNNYVILRNYQNELLAVEVDEETKNIKENILLISKYNKTELRSKKIGELKSKYKFKPLKFY